MQPEIEKAIDLIDRKIAELQRAKRTLFEAFGERSGQAEMELLTSSRSKKKKDTRKKAIVKMLQEEGPLSRSEIIQKTGFPLGTISTTLNDKDTFNSKDGKWYLIEGKQPKEQKEKGLTG